MKIVLIVIMVVAAFLMLATLDDGHREDLDIGILTAMGGTPTGVTTVFLSCGLVITCCGVASASR